MKIKLNASLPSPSKLKKGDIIDLDKVEMINIKEDGLDYSNCLMEGQFEFIEDDYIPKPEPKKESIEIGLRSLIGQDMTKLNIEFK
jgi:hypothetical protein